MGVRNKLAKISSLPEKTDLFGQAFEHFIAMELPAYLSYARKKLPLNFWRTIEGNEVDFLIVRQIAVEVKATSNNNCSLVVNVGD